MDVEAIKKAYRDQVKRYHPDAARSPERIRHNTIKCAEINRAFEECMRCSELDQGVAQDRKTRPPQGASAGARPEQRVRPVKAYQRREQGTAQTPASNNPDNRKRTRWWRFAPAVFSRLAVAIAVALLAATYLEVLGFPFGLLHSIIGFPKWLASLPLDHPARVIISGAIAVPIGILFGGLLSIFTCVPAVYVAFYLEKTRFAKYSFKLMWLVVTLANAAVVYSCELHWPFEHRANAYYAILYHVCRFSAWAFLPVYGLIAWLEEYRAFQRLDSTSKKIAMY
jgi:hypothetical protein